MPSGNRSPRHDRTTIIKREDFQLRLCGEPLLVFTPAGCGTEPHAPVAFSMKAEFAAAVIAAENHRFESVHAHIMSPSERSAALIADL